MTHDELKTWVAENRSELEDYEHPIPKMRFGSNTFADWCEYMLTKKSLEGEVWASIRARIPRLGRIARKKAHVIKNVLEG